MRLNSKKKHIETKYIVLYIILGISLLIGIISLTVKDDRTLIFIEKGIKDTGLTIQNIIYTPFRFVGSKIDDYKEMKRIYAKYKDIDKRASKVKLLEEENRELRKSLDELKKTLNLKSLITDYGAINATIVNRNVGYWYNTLTIDKGENDGVKEGMIVINNEGLIGKVIKATYYNCDVKLITTPDLNNKISVGITSNDNVTYGLLSGYDKTTKYLSVVDIIDNTDIKVGDKVVTSGLSETYPKGISVGVVSKIELDEFGISKIVKVTPYANFNDLRYVTVLKGHDNL